MAALGITMPESVGAKAVSCVTKVGSCAVRLADCDIDLCDELSLLSALAEYLLIRPGITVADKVSAVNVSLANDFFIVDILH